MSNSSEKIQDEELGRKASNKLDVQPTLTNDAVFGEISEDGPNYRDVGWKGTVALMLKSQIGLGVLSIPAAFDTLGLIPGLICMLVIGGIITWSNYIVGVFKVNHPEVYSIDDVGGILFGRAGKEIFGVIFSLYWVCVTGSGMLSISIGLNAVSTHGVCTAALVAVSAIVSFGLGSVQTLGKIKGMAWVGLICIIVALFIVTIAVGVQDRPASAPQEGPWSSDYKPFGNPTFHEASAALASLVFAYCGTPAFFSIVSEMKDPAYYPRALYICQGGMTAVYVTIGTIIYYFCGSFVASPALGSAGDMIKKIAYGISLPGLIVSTVLALHYPAKHIFIRSLRGSKHLSKNTPIHWMAWLGCTGGVTLIAYIIASAVPVFGGLVSLVGALLGTLMAVQPMACMWLYDNWSSGKETRSPRWMIMVSWCAFVFIAGTFLQIAGTYGSIVGIMDSYKESGGSAAWTCADNSGSV